jgi:hypothetical protein
VRRRALSAALAALALALALGTSPGARAAGPPAIEAAWPEAVTATSANLRAQIDPEGGVGTRYHFEYITEAAYLAGGESFSGAARAPAKLPDPPVSSPNPPVFQRLEGLAPATAYRFRVVASNGAGTSVGPPRFLATQEATNQHPPPDARAPELVSPKDKEGGAIAAPESLFGGGVFQAAASSAAPAITYSSAFSFGETEGFPGASQYLSARGAGAWATENITAPALSGSYGDRPDGVPYRLFSADLSRALMSNGIRCRDGGSECPVANPPLPGSGAPAGYRDYYLRSTNGFAALLTSALLAPAGPLSLGPDEFEVALASASADLAHVVLSSCAALSADASEVPAAGGCDESRQNLYEWSGGAPVALNLLPGQSSTSPGAALAAPAGAISADGQRVYFTEAEGGAIYLREAAGQTKLLPETTAGGATFQVASANGRIAYYTVGGVLRRYDAATEAATPIASAVSGVLGASADGSVVYFQDEGGLKRWQAPDTLTLLAAGVEVATPADFPPATGAARVSADGKHLAFLSAAQIPPFDNTDAASGQPDTELYLYGPPPGGGAPLLICASCNPTGERPRGSAQVPGALANGSTRTYKPRFLAASGNRVFFETAEGLVVPDTNAATDVYEWEAAGEGSCTRTPGCLGLLSGGRGPAASFLDASADGNDAYVLTEDSLLRSDPGSIDVYDIRAGGGLPEAEEPFLCRGDACQPLPSPPEDPDPASGVSTAGNPVQRYLRLRRHHRKKHKHKRGHHRHHGNGRGGARR